MMNNNILAIFTIATDNLPNNFQEIIKHEQEVVSAWKADGLIEHLFLRPTRNGAVIVFKDVDEARAKELMESLPLYQFVQSVEYFPLMKQF
jgi:muconolactone D-isomerase